MIPRTALTQLGKMIAQDMASGEMSEGLMEIGAALAADPQALQDLLALIAKEGRKKRPSTTLLQAFAFMLGQGLETLRFGIERHDEAAAAAVTATRGRLEALVREGGLDSGILQMVLRQFVTAKLDIGNALREMMAEQITADPPSGTPDLDDIDGMLVRMVRQCRGDAFLLQTELADQSATFPDEHRAGIVATLLGTTEAALHDIAIGWLLDPGPATRRDTAILLQQAANAGQITGVMLRRLITIRNWLPDDERPRVDAVIRSCRQKGVACASQPPAQLKAALATGIDGSGAQSLFAIIKDGRRHAAAALLVKQGFGVRDAWVQAGITKAEADEFIDKVIMQTDCYESSLESMRLTLANALANGRETGLLPPFGLLDVVERTGLATVNPEALPVEALLARLAEGIPAEYRHADTVAEMVADSAVWENRFPFTESWFEEDGALDALLQGKRLGIKRRTALVLEHYLPARRPYWAGLLAWSALTLRQEDWEETQSDEWIALAQVAEQVLGARPLAEIPLMEAIARRTAEAWAFRHK